MNSIICFIFFITIIIVNSTYINSNNYNSLLNLRGGAVPQASSLSNGDDYYEKFHLDYGCEDNIRIAGSMKGLLKSGKLSNLHENDKFLKWLNQKLEIGSQSPTSRVKPYYAADFGTRKDLNGENPKIIIVNRILEADKNGILLNGPDDNNDVEVREIWQPWLKLKCDFVVRYIIPNRINIIELMESKGRFHSELHIDKNSNGKKEAYAYMIFKPTILDRIKGYKDKMLKRKLDYSKLFDKQL